MTTRTFYLTTPIYYVNARPHALTKGLVAALGAGGPVGLTLGYGIAALVCLYAWRLYARGLLE